MLHVHKVRRQVGVPFGAPGIERIPAQPLPFEPPVKPNMSGFSQYHERIPLTSTPTGHSTGEQQRQFQSVFEEVLQYTYIEAVVRGDLRQDLIFSVR